MIYGDKVSWQYTHHLNGRSRIRRIKKGIFHSLVKHTVKYKGALLAYVLFEGNKGKSRVPLNELRAV